MSFESRTYTSPTLIQIQEQDFKNPAPVSVACRSCPSSVWMAGQGELRAYCRIMHTLTWSPDEQAAPTTCDGQLISLLEMNQEK